MFSPYDEWEKLSKEEYRQYKQDWAKVLVRQAEKFIPGLNRHIEVMEAASPPTYERYTGNWRGATAGWSWDPTGNPHFKFSEDVNLRNFFYVGRWVHSPARDAPGSSTRRNCGYCCPPASIPFASSLE